MNRQLGIHLLWAMLLIGICPVAASACKYSVREAGFAFVDGWPPVHFVLSHNDLSEEELETARKQVQQVLPTGFVVRVERRQQDSTNGDDGAVPSQQVSLYAVDSSDRSFQCGDADSDKLDALPEFARAFLDWPAIQKANGIASDATWPDLFLAHLGVMIIVPGTKAEEFESAIAIANRACSQVTDNLSQLEKPTDKGPITVVIDKADRERFCWSHRIDVNSEKTQMVVLYGRGRALGGAIDCTDENFAEIVRRLSLLGQSCECDLDRKWLFGAVTPHLWSEENRIRTHKILGFDPEHPVVQQEIRTILDRTGHVNSSAVKKSMSIEENLPQYIEIPLGASPMKNNSSTEDTLVATASEEASPTTDSSDHEPVPFPTQPMNGPVVRTNVNYTRITVIALAFFLCGVVYMVVSKR